MFSREIRALSTVFSFNAASLPRHMPRIPGDIVLGVIDHVDLPGLLRMALVCQEWRLLAHSHPTFWSTIEISSVRRASLECMLSRLSAAEAPIKQFSLTIPVEDPAVKSILLPALAAYLHRIEHLILRLHINSAAELWPVLRGAAPQMTELGIGFVADRMTVLHHVRLPADLFAGGAPKLVHFSGGNLRLPARPLAIFANVDTVVWTASHCKADNKLYLSPRQLSAHFPRMKQLSLDAPAAIIPHGPTEGLFNDQLTSLYVDLRATAHAVPAYLQRRPPKMVVAVPTDEILSVVLPDIDHSSLTCSIRTLPGDYIYPVFSIELIDVDNQITLEILDMFMTMKSSGVPPIFRNSAWCAQVTTLTLEHRIWCTRDFMRKFPPLISLRHLTLHMNGINARGRPAAKISCPWLQSVTVTALLPISWCRESFVDFLRRGLSVSLHHLSLTADSTVQLT